MLRGMRPALPSRKSPFPIKTEFRLASGKALIGKTDPDGTLPTSPQAGRQDKNIASPSHQPHGLAWALLVSAKPGAHLLIEKGPGGGGEAGIDAA